MNAEAIHIILKTLPEKCHKVYAAFCSTEYVRCNLWEFSVEADGTIFDGELSDGTVLGCPTWEPDVLEGLKAIQALITNQEN